MGFTLDDSFLSFEGGLSEDGKKKACVVWGAVLTAAVLVLFLLIFVWIWPRLPSTENFELAGGAPGRASLYPALLSSSVDSNDTPWGSAINRLGVDQDTVSVAGSGAEHMCGDNFTGVWKGQPISDVEGEAGYVPPGPDGKYQSLNPEAPGYFPSTLELADQMVKSTQVSVPEARVAAAAISRYRLGRIDASNCGDLAGITAREAAAAYDWQNTVAESPYSGSAQLPAEHFMKERLRGARKGERMTGSMFRSSANDVSRAMAGL